MNDLGLLFERFRTRPDIWRNLFFVILAVLVGLNFVIRPEEAHFGWDSLPGFFAGFGLVIGAILLFVLEKIVRPLLARKEDFYGDL
jgi:hypothetical protein